MPTVTLLEHNIHANFKESSEGPSIAAREFDWNCEAQLGEGQHMLAPHNRAWQPSSGSSIWC